MTLGNNLILLFFTLSFFSAHLTWAQISDDQEQIFIAVVGGTSFGDQASFGKGLVQEEGVFTVETKKGTSPQSTR